MRPGRTFLCHSRRTDAAHLALPSLALRTVLTGDSLLLAPI